MLHGCEPHDEDYNDDGGDDGDGDDDENNNIACFFFDCLVGKIKLKVESAVNLKTLILVPDRCSFRFY